jgi:hypothetical protein
LLLGLAAGWCFEHRQAEHRVTEVAVQMVQGIEASDRLEAARGIRAIELIQSGNTEQAVQMFSVPIADFYTGHVNLTNNDERTKDWLARIDQFSRTNEVVAAQIRTAMSYSATNAKAQ